MLPPGGRAFFEGDLLIERDQLDVKPAASIAFQRQRIKSIVDDWSVMADDEKKRLLQLILTAIRADHTSARLVVEFRVRAQSRALRRICAGGAPAE